MIMIADEMITEWTTFACDWTTARTPKVRMWSEFSNLVDHKRMADAFDVADIEGNAIKYIFLRYANLRRVIIIYGIHWICIKTTTKNWHFFFFFGRVINGQHWPTILLHERWTYERYPNSIHTRSGFTVTSYMILCGLKEKKWGKNTANKSHLN